MKIVFITPGSGDHYYCENCLRDHAIVKALINLGHDVIQVPLYLPPQMEETGRDLKSPLFFGGVNVYLQQNLSLFRKTPRWIDRIFDSRKILEIARKRAGATRSTQVGPTLVSMLQGEEGRQKKEISRLAEWIVEEGRPDWVVLNNLLLIGLTKALKTKLKCRVACLLQDEDSYLDSLEEPLKTQAWGIVKEKSRIPDLLIAVSRYYQEVMKKRLDMPQIPMIYPGVDLSGFDLKEPPDTPSIGFLSRMCKDKGLDLLVQAFIKIKEEHKTARLGITGGKNADDEPFVESLKKLMEQKGVINDVSFYESFEREERQEFLSSLTVLSVPERRGEAWGLYAIEAMAAGVPVVQARNGFAIELLEKTRGGLLFDPNDVNSLASTLSKLLQDPEGARAMGLKGREGVIRNFDVNQYAKTLIQTLNGPS